MTNANVEKKGKKRQKNESYAEVNSYEKWKKASGIKESLQKLY